MYWRSLETPTAALQTLDKKQTFVIKKISKAQVDKMSLIKGLCTQIDKIEKIRIRDYNYQFDTPEDYITHFARLFDCTVNAKSLANAGSYSLLELVRCW